VLRTFRSTAAFCLTPSSEAGLRDRTGEEAAASFFSSLAWREGAVDACWGGAGAGLAVADCAGGCEGAGEGACVPASGGGSTQGRSVCAKLAGELARVPKSEAVNSHRPDAPAMTDLQIILSRERFSCGFGFHGFDVAAGAGGQAIECSEPVKSNCSGSESSSNPMLSGLSNPGMRRTPCVSSAVRRHEG
jgi:hypothetical protein